ncbi:MAG: hypothetical protein DI535_14230 [Citrobacter freundii]|nr:MAG: hypothetical protein DI535_14230 [Citrobacter freundii]
MSQITIAELEKKQTSPGSAAKAEIWLPKAEQADHYRNKLVHEIERIANSCKENGGPCKESELARLKNSLKEYEDSILNTDGLINAEFAGNFSDSSANREGLVSISNRLNTRNNFSQTEWAALFAQLRLAVTQNAHSVIRFCNEQVTDPGFYYTVYSAIVAQNSGTLLPGEQLEITAGIGAFSRRAQPKALINGRPCELREDATFKYLIRPKGKPGVYTIPVVLDFVDEEGKPMKVSKTVTYRLLPAVD